MEALYSNNSFNDGSPLQGDNLRVFISGAGPAGLIRCIEALKNGCTVRIIEKRGEGAQGRANTVALDEHSIRELDKHGIYQRLLDNGRIYPPNRCGYICVRLGDLEDAMKEAIHEISPETVIEYGKQIEAIDDKGNITIGGEIIEAPDIIVNAEGACSNTNVLMNNLRVPVLPNVPVIAAIFEDARPEMDGFANSMMYIAKTIAYFMMGFFYFMVYLFKVLFQGECICFENRVIAGSLILTTPGQNYLGVGFTREMSEKLRDLQHAVKQAPEDSEEKEAAKKELDSFVHFWSNVAFFYANTVALLFRIFDHETHYENAMWLPFKKYSITEIGADRAEHFSKVLGKRTIYMVAGDAAFTVDPTTGTGCNLALKTVTYFREVLSEWRRQTSFGLSWEYDDKTKRSMNMAHENSKRHRRAYRPDALELPQAAV